MATEMDISAAIEYINNHLNYDENKSFEEWLRSENNAKEFDDFKKYWQISGRAFSSYEADVEKGWSIIDSRTDKKILSKRIRPEYYNVLKIAASILLLLALSFAIKVSYNFFQRQEMVALTSNNQKTQVILPDSSVVWLNVNSKLEAPKKFKGKVRNVILNGEAFFEVRKNPAKPFKINTGQTTIEVLGTSFNIYEQKDQIIVSVATGKVAFYSNKTNNRLILIPGQKGTFDIEKGEMSLEKLANNNFMAWKTGKLQFKDASLAELCEALGGFYHIKIQSGNFVNDPHYIFTGIIDNSPCDEALNTIALTLGIKFKKTGNDYKIEL